MKRHHKVAAGGVVTALAVLVPLAIQVDRWMIERRQMEIAMQHDREVANCEQDGGRWWRGECREPSE
jgi:hypothetical protein